MMRARGGEGSGGWLHWLQAPADPRLELYCIPHAGGAADTFATWRGRLPADVAVAAIQLPGRRERFHEALATDVGSVSAALAALLGRERSRPFMLFGHSLGAVVAFDAALRLEARRAPREIVVAGCGSPTRPRRAQPLHALPSAEFRARIGRMGGTPPEILADKDLMDLFEPVLRSDLKMAETYQAPPQARTSAVITAWGGVDDALVSPEDLKAWSECTSAASACRIFPGGHFFPQSHSDAVLPALCARIEAVKSGRPARPVLRAPA